MRKVLFVFCCILCTLSLRAQTMGEWIFYSPYGALTSITCVGDEVFAVGGGSLFSYHLKDEAIREYTKNDGMSDASIAFMGYDEKYKALILVYKNQNIDLFIQGKFYNISDFKDKTMTQNKTINSLYVADGYAYLATRFGAVVVDLSRRQIADTYNLGINAKVVFLYNGNVCLGTDSGIMSCPLSLNAYDLSNWKHSSYLSAKQVAFYQSSLYVLDINNEVYKLDGWTTSRFLPNDSYQSLQVTDGKLFFLNRDFIDFLEMDGQVNRVNGLTAVNGLIASKDQYWLATDQGIEPLKEENGNWLAAGTYYLPNAPITVDPYNMDVRNGRIYISSGGPYRTFNTDPGVISVLEDGQWHNFTHADITQGHDHFNQLLDIRGSSIDPETFYVSSFTGGVYEFSQNQFVRQYIDDNNEFESVFGKGEHIWVSALNTDKQGNLWAVNMAPSKHYMRMKTPDGKWYKYKINGLAAVNDVNPLLITQYGRSQQKWGISYYNYLTLNVFDDKGTYDDTSDDESVTYSSIIDQDNNTYTMIQFRSLVEDLDGHIWLGTSIGPFIFNNPSNIYSIGGNRCTRVKLARNDGTGLADYLLDNVTITCMAVDAANRKWIGTSGNGVYLLSSDGTETIHHFTSSNSPLTSDEILSMGIDSETGIVYFGCMGGLVAYRSDAIAGKASFSEVYAYPNPVYPDYTGVVTITGLMSNTLVKITDINNNLIYQSNSLGGQLTWNGLDVKGNRVKSGVYLVYGSAQDGQKGMVTKILFVN